MGAAAGALICLTALVGLLITGGRGQHWPGLLLVQGISALLLVALLARAPMHCAVSGLGYPGHWLLAMGLGGAAVLVGVGEAAGLGGLAMGIGLVLLLLCFGSAARALRWQLVWCHGRPGLALRLAPVAVLVCAAGLAIATICLATGADGLAAAGGSLALIAWVVLVLGLRETGRAPVLG
jgi:hypothetical protein